MDEPLTTTLFAKEPMSLIKRTTFQAEPPLTPPPVRTLAELLLALDLGDPQARRSAALELAAWPEAASDLLARLSTETTLPVRVALIDALLLHPRVETARGLGGLLRSEDASLRSHVAEALVQLPREVSQLVEGWLRDPDSDFRIQVVTILSGLSHPNVASWLLRAAQTDAHPNVVLAALEGLSGCYRPELANRLLVIKERFPSTPLIVLTVEALLAQALEPRP